MPWLTERADIERVLREARTIAVLGAHVERVRAAFYVPDYLHTFGYRLFPVNPGYLGQVAWGEPFRAHLADLGGEERIDVVDVFRPSRAVAAHLADILAMAPRPRLVWLQLGIRDDATAAALVGEGIDVVQDRCMLADHQAFGLDR